MGLQEAGKGVRVAAVDAAGREHFNRAHELQDTGREGGGSESPQRHDQLLGCIAQAPLRIEAEHELPQARLEWLQCCLALSKDVIDQSHHVRGRPFAYTQRAGECLVVEAEVAEVLLVVGAHTPLGSRAHVLLHRGRHVLWRVAAAAETCRALVAEERGAAIAALTKILDGSAVAVPHRTWFLFLLLLLVCLLPALLLQLIAQGKVQPTNLDSAIEQAAGGVVWAGAQVAHGVSTRHQARLP